MLRVGLIGLIRLYFCSSKKLATPLEFAESQVGAEEASPSVWQYLRAVPEEITAARFCPLVAINPSARKRRPAFVSSRSTDPSCRHIGAQSDLDEGRKLSSKRRYEGGMETFGETEREKRENGKVVYGCWCGFGAAISSGRYNL
jgi:hypothetical protein